MERKTKIALGIISTLVVGGGVWFLLFKRKRKKHRTFYFGNIYCGWEKGEYEKEGRDCSSGIIQISLSNEPMVDKKQYDIEGDAISIGDEIKIIDTDALLNGKHKIIGLIPEKESIRQEKGINSILIRTDYDVKAVGDFVKKNYKVSKFKNKGKIILTKHKKSK